ncbi:hypothetical protein MRX96_006372 [Rhipicephalus microplus]
MRALGLIAALFSSCLAVSTVKRYPLKPCSGYAVARIENVAAQKRDGPEDRQCFPSTSLAHPPIRANSELGVYHAQMNVFGYQAFYFTTEGGKSDLRIEVIDSGKVVGCYSSTP